MRGKKNEQAALDAKMEDLAAELLSDSSDSEHDAWDGFDAAAYGSLAFWVGRVGGLCSLGSADGGRAIYCSVRLGKQARPYRFDDALQLNDWCAREVDRWKSAYLRSQEPPPAA